MRQRLVLIFAFASSIANGARGDESVAASVASSLPTASAQIRQFAFDGDDSTFFASEAHPKADAHFTLTFERPVAVRSASARSGRADGSDRLDSGVLEGSEDGSNFFELAKFSDGTAKAEAAGKKLKAIRVRATAEQPHPLALRELAVEGDEPVGRFRYPVEFAVDVADAPEMKAWAEDVARLCEVWYPRINDALRSDGYRPPTQITMALKKDYGGVAEAGNDRIKGSVKYFQEHPADKGAMIHETVHLVQHYRSRSNPGWLVEGVADYFRFFVFEPGKAGRLNPDRARYNASYRITAAFLDFVARTYDKELILKLNRQMRAGKYRAELFQELTGKTLPELETEWRASIKG